MREEHRVAPQPGGRDAQAGREVGALGDALLERPNERGLLVGTAGNNTLRLAPPLVVTEDDVREALDIIDQQFASMMTAAGS